MGVKIVLGFIIAVILLSILGAIGMEKDMNDIEKRVNERNKKKKNKRKKGIAETIMDVIVYGEESLLDD